MTPTSTSVRVEAATPWLRGRGPRRASPLRRGPHPLTPGACDSSQLSRCLRGQRNQAPGPANN